MYITLCIVLETLNWVGMQRQDCPVSREWGRGAGLGGQGVRGGQAGHSSVGQAGQHTSHSITGT